MKAKWKIVLKGNTGIVEVNLPEANAADNSFTGTITSDAYGTVPIENGGITQQGGLDVLSGDVELDDHDAKFSATIGADGNIHGFVKVGWFFSADFVGVKIDA